MVAKKSAFVEGLKDMAEEAPPSPPEVREDEKPTPAPTTEHQRRRYAALSRTARTR
ncbi:hypothetical protein [Lichenibacterium minor]|uniref:hypothetical protein n=1 Tax=Lichenibacterium minor TaxID=2316528 RepID=UPI0013ECDAF7|nr:hypothetical protein [Lichenibacterium minor]